MGRAKGILGATAVATAGTRSMAPFFRGDHPQGEVPKLEISFDENGVSSGKFFVDWERKRQIDVLRIMLSRKARIAAFYGPSGSGKSAMAHQVAAITKLPYTSLDISGDHPVTLETGKVQETLNVNLSALTSFLTNLQDSTVIEMPDGDPETMIKLQRVLAGALQGKSKTLTVKDGENIRTVPVDDQAIVFFTFDASQKERLNPDNLHGIRTLPYENLPNHASGIRPILVRENAEKILQGVGLLPEPAKPYSLTSRVLGTYNKIAAKCVETPDLADHLKDISQSNGRQLDDLTAKLKDRCGMSNEDTTDFLTDIALQAYFDDPDAVDTVQASLAHLVIPVATTNIQDSKAMTSVICGEDVMDGLKAFASTCYAFGAGRRAV